MTRRGQKKESALDHRGCLIPHPLEIVREIQQVFLNTEIIMIDATETHSAVCLPKGVRAEVGGFLEMVQPLLEGGAVRRRVKTASRLVH